VAAWLGGKVRRMNFASPLAAARGWLQRTRCKWLLVMTLLCLVLRENYPFSQFPMYASFSHKTYYLYLTNATGEEIPTQPFAISNSGLRKIFDSYYRIASRRFARTDPERVPLSEKEAGQKLLAYLASLPVVPALKKPIADAHVERVDIHQENQQLLFQSHIVASAHE